MQFALNHMTVARRGFAELVDIAAGLGCVGVELRNDLPGPLFDGMAAQEAGTLLRDRGLRLLALAEIKRFNDWTPERAAEAAALMAIARAAGAEAVSLIPRNDNLGLGNGERQANLRLALRDLAPMLRDHGLLGLVEPLGFATCALRDKGEAVEVIEALEAGDVLRLVHDSFHHHLSGDGALYPAQTGIVHVSGVAAPARAVEDMTDADRGLVGGDDVLGNVTQLAALLQGGYDGPVSFECFAPGVHALDDPAAALAASMDHLRDRLAAKAA